MNAFHVEIKNLSFSYKDRPVLRKLSLQLESGRLYCLLGNNGAGKTTLFKLMLALLPPPSGTIFFAGRDLADFSTQERARQIAYIPQEERANFRYRAEEIVLMGRAPRLGLLRQPKSSDLRQVAAVMAKLRIGHLAGRYYPELSGGERQLLRIARALLQDSPFLIMDEPCTGLDYGHQMRMLETAKQLAREGYLVLFSSHNPQQAELFADEILLLRDGQMQSSQNDCELLSEIYNYPLKRYPIEGKYSALLPDLSYLEERFDASSVKRS
ncbi:MAG: ABC transporter ATP-binding protein [Eubacteriales bacterium]|nr:ABC transporter ATP-binding protein [Eubacteriales bacterium]